MKFSFYAHSISPKRIPKKGQERRPFSCPFFGILFRKKFKKTRPSLLSRLLSVPNPRGHNADAKLQSNLSIQP